MHLPQIESATGHPLIIIGELRLHPAVVEGMGAHEVVEGEEGGKDAAVVPPGAEQLDEAGKPSAVLPRKEFLHHAARAVPPQDLKLLLVPRADVGGDAQQLEILPDELAAKGVDRADLRPPEQQLLAAQAGVFGVFGGQRRHPRHDPLLHFERRRVGKGHDEQPVGVDRLLGVEDAPYRPFDEHRRLARARRRRDEHRPAARLDRVPLPGGPLTLSHPPHPLPSP